MEVPANKFSHGVRDITKADNKHENGPVGVQVSELAKIKNAAKEELNAAIIQSSIDVSSASSSPQALLLKTALEGINDALKASMGENAIQNAYDSGLDVSPEATAERIVSLSTAFFGSFQEQHPELSEEEALTKFIDVISGGIDTGFSEARDILSGLQVLEGDIASNIDSTYDLVQQGLRAFIDSFTSQEEATDTSIDQDLE